MFLDQFSQDYSAVLLQTIDDLCEYCITLDLVQFTIQLQKQESTKKKYDFIL